MARTASASDLLQQRMWDAVGDGELSEVHRLLKLGADFHWVDEDGWTYVCLAALKGRAEVVKILHHYGSDIHRPTTDGRSPLRIAAFNGHTEVVKFLLAHGAALDLACRAGKTPLAAAAFKGHADIVQMLLAHGASAAPSDASRHDLSLLLEQLCSGEQSAGAPRCSTPPPTLSASTPANVLVICKSEATLAGSLAVNLDSLWATAGDDQLDDLRRVLRSGALGAGCWLDRNGWSPVCYAALNQRLGALQLLVAHGADVNQPTGDGRTPLRIAAFNGHTEVVRFLLAHGAEVNAACQQGKSPLYIAALNGHADACRLLYESGGTLSPQKGPDYIKARTFLDGLSSSWISPPGTPELESAPTVSLPRTPCPLTPASASCPSSRSTSVAGKAHRLSFPKTSLSATSFSAFQRQGKV